MHKNVTTIVVIDTPRPTMSRSAYDRAVHVIPGLVGEFSATLHVRYSPYTLFCGLASNTTPLAHWLPLRRQRTPHARRVSTVGMSLALAPSLLHPCARPQPAGHGINAHMPLCLASHTPLAHHHHLAGRLQTVATHQPAQRNQVHPTGAAFPWRL